MARLAFPAGRAHRLVIPLLGASALAAAAVGLARAADAAFPGHNGKIAFVSGRSNPNGDIYVMKANGTGVVRLTTDTEENGEPAWSPNGKKIVYVSHHDFASAGQDIWVMNADGSGKTRLTDTPADDFDPSWSPNGQKIVFVSSRDNPNGDLYVMNADGSGIVRLTSTAPRLERAPAWSPNGKQIVYGSYPSSNNTRTNLWVVNADGTGRHQLTSNGYDNAPTWSPDGKWIAYVHISKLWVVRANGTGAHAITTGPRIDQSPAWSPDGKTIAFASDRTGTLEIWLANPSGAGLYQLTHKAKLVRLETRPDWQPVP